MATGILGKIFSNMAAKVIGEAGKIVDDVITNDEEKLTLTNKLKELLTNFVSEIEGYKTQIITTEMQGNWLQRSWRPIIMLIFAGVIIYSMIFPTHLSEVPEKLWSLLMIGIGGYIGGRTIEKTADKVSSNMDISFKRKRDR